MVLVAGISTGTVTTVGAFLDPPAAGDARVVAAASVQKPAPTVHAAAPEVDQALVAERLALADAASRSAHRASLTAWPARGALTGWFGERRGRGRHPGVDIDGSTGDPVSAAGAGIVRVAGRAPAGYSGYGLMVVVDHGGGVETLYAHLSRINVGAGELLSAGDRIGAIGTTGSVTGSHLHFEVRIGGRQVDPKPWLPARR